MKRYNYDFRGFETAMSHLRQRQDKATLKEIKNELNKFFKDSECGDVIFTKNTDKLFFGMTTYMVLTEEEVKDIILDDGPLRIYKYYIEIDSKLLDIGLSKSELVAVLLHEVGHVVNDSTPADEVRKAIDVYMAKEGDNISIENVYNNPKFLKLAVADTIRKFGSIFTRNDEEILADEFVVTCGYGEQLESAYKKIVASTGHINSNVSGKLITLDWTFKVYKNMKYYRNIALRILNKSKALTGSVYEKREIDDAINSLKEINMDNLRESKIVYESIVVENCCFMESEDNKNKSFIGRIRHKGLRGLEEDVYEYQMRIRNVEDSNDAIMLMRQINSRMAVLDDYLNSCGDEVSDREYARWEKCLSKYDLLRDELAKKTVYNKKNYGLWFDMNYANAMEP